MADIRVAKRYAKSIFELAEEKEIVDEVREGMLLLSSVTAQTRGFHLMLKNPIIRYDYKLRIIQRIFKGKVDDLTLRFFELVCKKNRAELLPSIARVFIDLYNESKGIEIAKVKTAIPLSEEMRSAFEAMLKKEGKTILLEEEVDKDIIGGYVLQIGDNQADNSMSSKLRTLKRELTKE